MTSLRSLLGGLAALAAAICFVPSAAADALEAGHARGMCLDFTSGRGVLARCSGQEAQDFQLPNYGANYLRVGRYCVAAGREGEQLYAGNCKKNRSDQYWSYNQNGTLVNGSGLCADIEGGGKHAGARLIGYRCSGKANQRFSVWQGGYDPGYPGGGYQVSVLLSPQHAPGMCLDRDKSSNRLILFGCHGKSNQVFTLSQDGRTEIRVNNGCLTAPANRGPVYVATCNGSAQQRWVLRRDSTIRHDASGLCLDVEGAERRQHTQIITYKCSGKSNQRFNLYQR